MLKLLLGAALMMPLALWADDLTVHYSASAELNSGSGDFAPSYIMANRHGTLTQAAGGQLALKAWRPLDLSQRFSWAFAAEAWTGVTTSTDYLRYRSGEWTAHPEHPARLWLQQLYAEAKYRGVFIAVGLKEHESALLNQRLSSGDLVESGNSRPLPEARVGFIDFQNIPFTNGWVQIQGEIGWGKCMDNAWQRNHFSYYNYHITLGSWYNYKRCFFRTNPSQPLSVTVGLQAAAQFAGRCDYYYHGNFQRTEDSSFRLRDLVDMLVIRGGEAYWKGNHVGAWDFNARLALRNGHTLKAYFQWLWEDGSGIGKLNGMDGLWGVEWKAPSEGPVSGAVLEFMTYMNQSGPLHYDAADIAGTTMTGHSATGSDNYYNNTVHNGYAYYGLSIGSPMFISPIHNTDGFTTAFVDNRFWGLHLGVEGRVSPTVRYRVLGSYRKLFGTYFVPRIHPVQAVSAMAEARWTVTQVPGLDVKAQAAFDAGNSPLSGVGALVSVTYSGLFNFKK